MQRIFNLILGLLFFLIGGVAFNNFLRSPMQTSTFTENFSEELTNISQGRGWSYPGINFNGKVLDRKMTFKIYTNQLLKCGYSLKYNQEKSMSVGGTAFYKVAPGGEKRFQKIVIKQIGEEQKDCGLELDCNNGLADSETICSTFHPYVW